GFAQHIGRQHDVEADPVGAGARFRCTGADEGIGVLVHQFSGIEQALAALAWWQCCPRREGIGGGLHGGIRVFQRGSCSARGHRVADRVAA
ncbi:hypothetical protein NY473_03080, partial [Enterobacter kobei]